MTVLRTRSIFIPASAKFSKGKRTYANPSRGISASCSQDQSKGKQKTPQTIIILPKQRKKKAKTKTNKNLKQIQPLQGTVGKQRRQTEGGITVYHQAQPCTPSGYGSGKWLPLWPEIPPNLKLATRRWAPISQEARATISLILYHLRTTFYATEFLGPH